MLPMGTFHFVTLTIRYPPMEIGENIGIYTAQMVLTNPSPIFTGGQKSQFWSLFSTRFRIGGLLIAYCVCNVC